MESVLAVLQHRFPSTCPIAVRRITPEQSLYSYVLLSSVLTRTNLCDSNLVCSEKRRVQRFNPQAMAPNLKWHLWPPQTQHSSFRNMKKSVSSSLNMEKYSNMSSWLKTKQCKFQQQSALHINKNRGILMHRSAFFLSFTFSLSGFRSLLGYLLL